MRKNGIRSKIVKKYKATTDSNHNLPVAENILNRKFKATSNKKWVSDITYMWNQMKAGFILQVFLIFMMVQLLDGQ